MSTQLKCGNAARINNGDLIYPNRRRGSSTTVASRMSTAAVHPTHEARRAGSHQKWDTTTYFKGLPNEQLQVAHFQLFVKVTCSRIKQVLI